MRRSLLASWFHLILCLLASGSSQGFANVKSMSNSTKNPLHLSKEPAVLLNSGVGGLTFVGGVMGYAKAKSKASLIAGSSFGGLLLVSAFLLSSANSTQKQWGAALGSTVAGLLTYTMGKKFLSSGKFVPAGLIASFGAFSCVVSVVEWIMATGGSNKAEF